MKLKNKFQRTAIFVLALILASVSSLAVYASVSYDSSKDPVVAFSGMVSYVESVLKSIRESVASIEARLTLLELTGPSGGGSGGGGMSAEQYAEIMAEINALKESNAELAKENASLKNELKNTKNEFLSLIDELSAEYDVIKGSISALSTDITNLQNQITSTKNDLVTLQKNFKQISDISTKLETVSLKLNNLTSSKGDITVLKNQYKALEKQYNDLIAEIGKIYSTVFVPYGATIIATKADDTAMLILRSGSAIAVSPYTEPGKIQGINNLTEGVDILDGQNIPLFNSILIPRGGEDGRGVKVTSLEGAYFMIGGDYTIVEP
jgi:archaellum component FlaC